MQNKIAALFAPFCHTAKIVLDAGLCINRRSTNPVRYPQISYNGKRSLKNECKPLLEGHLEGLTAEYKDFTLRHRPPARDAYIKLKRLYTTLEA
jgi:hypothetical protein